MKFDDECVPHNGSVDLTVTLEEGSSEEHYQFFGRDSRAMKGLISLLLVSVFIVGAYFTWHGQSASTYVVEAPSAPTTRGLEECYEKIWSDCGLDPSCPYTHPIRLEEQDCEDDDLFKFLCGKRRRCD